MRDECTAFLQWALPRLGMRWRGFRRVRSQVCKRIAHRISELGLDGFQGYRGHLEQRPEEWRRLDGMCRITISRFWRDRRVMAALVDEVLPRLAASTSSCDDPALRCLSCGCASGEEPYSLQIGWRERGAAKPLEIVAVDADLQLLARARRGVYPEGTLRELPARWRKRAFEEHAEGFRLIDHLRDAISWLCMDVRAALPRGPFDLVVCRNLAFTYYAESLQRSMAGRLAAVLGPGGALVIGSHESLPKGTTAFEPWPGQRAIFRRREKRQVAKSRGGGAKIHQ